MSEEEREHSDYSDDENEEVPIQAYSRRWVVLSIAAFAIALRGYNQSCYGPINNAYTEYFKVEPWQVDWLVVIQSVIFLTVALPMTLLITRLGYRLSVILITTTLTLGFTLTTAAVSWRGGFGMMLSGQAVMGFSNIVSWSIPPATAAIWFPRNEVATAVAIQVVGRGVGEAIGSFLPTYIISEKPDMSNTQVSLVTMFGILSGLAFFLALFAMFFVKNSPPTPPSEAQAKLIRVNDFKQKREESSLRSTWDTFASVVQSLFRDKIFIAVWFVFGAVNPILRNNNVLLTSMLHHRFNSKTKINAQAGIVLLVAWCMYTVGGFIAGPLITKTKRYKTMVFLSVFLLLLSCVVILVGVKVKNLDVIYAGVMTQGLFIGMANTSLFELLAEVTYPHPPMFVTMISIVILGMFRLIYPLVGRFILKQFGATWSTAFPTILTAICTLVIALLKPEYKRESTNQAMEYKTLIKKDLR
ncbi:unnamed protein product [Clavelina lepadiformis]|uniref:Major facilitator superfamily (MFS) profile domain-containing protein n=1 Tax=Clavelina lepadiformis TaxID=159417 RepID=A0ABP0G3H3_CLALP